MDIHLRKATEDDLAVVLEILNAGTVNKMRRGDLAWGMSEHDPNLIRPMVASGKFYIAYAGEIAVGTCAIAWEDTGMWGQQPPEAGYMQRLAIASGQNGQNIGGQMLELLLEEVAKVGRQYLRTAIPSGNAKLRTYYENHGFVRADQKVRPPIHPSYPAAYYEKNVTASGLASSTNEKNTAHKSILGTIFGKK